MSWGLLLGAVKLLWVGAISRAQVFELEVGRNTCITRVVPVA
jgi:hypothetical protein